MRLSLPVRKLSETAKSNFWLGWLWFRSNRSEGRHQPLVAEIRIVMSALGHWQTLASKLGRSALPLRTDMLGGRIKVRQVPKADIG